MGDIALRFLSSLLRRGSVAGLLSSKVVLSTDAVGLAGESLRTVAGAWSAVCEGAAVAVAAGAAVDGVSTGATMGGSTGLTAAVVTAAIGTAGVQTRVAVGSTAVAAPAAELLVLRPRRRRRCFRGS